VTRELSAPLRLAALGAGLAVVLAGSLALGRATGGAVAQAAPAPGAAEEHGGAEHAGGAAGARDGAVTGTSLSDGGLRLEVPTTVLPPLTTTPFTFRVLGEQGPVTEYDVEQGKRMHLVLVSRDLSRHAHLHPELGPDGTWRTPLTLAAGTYRAVADFSVDGERRSLAVDLAAPGPLAPKPLPAASTTALVDDLRVELERDGSTLSFTAFRGSAPVDPEPYLGARGHLVAFRAGDLAYAHVHPSGDHGATTSYEAELPGPGTYRLFLEVQIDGQVRLAPFTLEVS
jgi:hypothetical protein